MFFHVAVLIIALTLSPGQAEEATSSAPAEDVRTSNLTSRDYACPAIDINFAGDDIGYVEGVDSWQECGRQCEHFYECKYWTFGDSHTGYYHQCYLKFGNSGFSINSAFISGARGCK